MADISKEAVRTIQKRIGSTPFPDGFQGIANDASMMITALAAKLAEVEAELHTMKTAGVIEVAVRNPSVSEYMAHWEGRAEAASAALDIAYRSAVDDAAMIGVDWANGELGDKGIWEAIMATPTPTPAELLAQLKEKE